MYRYDFISNIIFSRLKSCVLLEQRPKSSKINDILGFVIEDEEITAFKQLLRSDKKKSFRKLFRKIFGGSFFLYLKNFFKSKTSTENDLMERLKKDLEKSSSYH